MNRSLTAALLLGTAAFAPSLGAQVVSPETSRATIVTAAADIMRSARYATLITLGEDGRPQARIVDPFVPEGDLTIWIGTNPLTRKVRQIQADSRVTLLYFNPAAAEYVTVLGTAELVADSSLKALHWKEEWAAFYKDRNRGPDYILIRVRASRLEVVSPRHGLTNDPITWRPVVLDLP